MSTERVLYKGENYYGILVKRDIVYSSFGSWCVQDASAKWALPAQYGKKANEKLCDRDPHDDGAGTYLFTVR